MKNLRIFKKIKAATASILALALLISIPLALSSCGEQGESPRIMALKGPTGMGMAKLIEDGEYDVTLESDPQKVQAAIVAGETDIAAVPVNLAAALYNKTEGGVKVFAVNTLGVLYLLENGNEISSVSDLRGKKISATGQGSTPEYILRYVLKANGLDPDTDVEIEWIAENTVLAASAASGDAQIALLPEPTVTAALAQSKEAGTLRVALNMTEQWSLVESSELVQGVMIVRSEYYEENAARVESFMSDYAASVEYITTDEGAPAIIAKHGIVASEGVAASALPRCNIVFRDGDMKAALEPILTVLYNENAKSVGGKLPSDDFYLSLKAK